MASRGDQLRGRKMQYRRVLGGLTVCLNGHPGSLRLGGTHQSRVYLRKLRRVRASQLIAGLDRLHLALR